MSLAVRCDRCGKSQSVPDSLVGAPIICSYCGQQVIVSADAPLMPPPLPGTAPAAAPRLAGAASAGNPVAAPPAKMPVPRPPQRGAGAVPMSRPGGGPVPASPPTAPPPASPPPVPPPAPPRREPAYVEPVLETYERAVKLQKPSIWPWILGGGMAVVILIAMVVALAMQVANPNPAPSSVANRFVANPAAVSRLGPRQTELGYSLQLPSDFAATTAPPTEGMPAGTQSFAWAAKPGTEGAGSLLRVWVIPKTLNIDQELQTLNGLGGLLDYPGNIENKSTYHRLGDSMLAVRGLIEGSDATSIRKGVIYLIADAGQTIILVGMATGPKVAELQALLDHGIRTLQRDNAPAASPSTQAAVSGT